MKSRIVDGVKRRCASNFAATRTPVVSAYRTGTGNRTRHTREKCPSRVGYPGRCSPMLVPGQEADAGGAAASWSTMERLCGGKGEGGFESF
jgi:hypothetical protein